MGSPGRSPFRQIVLAVVLLISAIATAACPDRLSSQDEDERPVIIISSGSVTVDVSPGVWTKESGRGQRYRQKDEAGKKYKSVKTFSATTGTCTVTGDKLVVTYGSSTMNLERKKSGLFSKHDPVVQFPDDANVTASGGTLTVATNDSLGKVTNGGTGAGNECGVVDKKISVQPKR